MGYNTKFRGELKFASNVTVPMLGALNDILGEDVRDHPEWQPHGEACYIDLVLTKKMDGLRWDDGTEKTYGLTDAVNIVTRVMRQQWPDFKLSGSLLAQGEDADDRWSLTVDDEGTASRTDLVVTGEKVTCPNCKKAFRIERAG